MSITEFALASLALVAIWCFYEGIIRPTLSGMADEYLERIDRIEDEEERK